MSDLTRDFPVVFSPGVNNVEQSFGKDDNELKRIYTILTSLRGMYKSGTPPTSPNSGDKWHDLTNNVIKEWNGSAWIPCPAIAALTGATFTGVVNEALGTPIASASTINLTTATGNFLHITGTTTITAVTLGAGMRREVIFDGILTLTHHATNNNLPSGANITTAVGDRATYYSDGTTAYCTKYQKADGTAVVASASLTIASEAEAIAGTDNTKAITPLRIRNAFNASGTAPVYACRAWVNFNGVPLNGTYSQSGTTVTVTMTLHGLTVGDKLNLSITSGTGVSGSYVVATVPTANSFTYTAGTSLTTSGNITRNIYIRASGNISSIVDNAVGDYTINFITNFEDSNYVVNAINTYQNDLTSDNTGIFIKTLSTSNVRLASAGFSTPLRDATIVSVAIFR